MAASYRSKESEQPHSCTSFPYVHYKLSSKLRSKRRLRVQNRPAGCILSCAYPSKQQKVPQVRLRKQGVTVSGATIRSEHSPSSFYSFGAHGDRLSASSGNFGDTLSRRLVNSPPRPPSSTLTSGSALKYAGPSRLYPKQKEIRAGPDSGSPVSRNTFTSGLMGSFPSTVQSLGDSCMRTPSILPSSTNLLSSVLAHGVTQLGLRSYPSGSFVPETSSTSFSLIRSDKPVYATASIRPSGPCQPSQALAGPTLSYLRNPDPHFSGGFYDFYGRLYAGVGRSHGGFPDFGYLDPYRPQAPYQLSGARGGNLCPAALGPSAPGYDRYGQFNSSFVYIHLVTFDSRASPLVRGSEHNSPSKTHSRLSEHDSRPPISSESANIDRVVPTPRDRETHLQGLGDTRSRHVCDTVELPPSSVHVSSSGAKSPSGGCSVSRLAGEVNVHVSTLSPAQQGRAEVTVHPCGRGDSRSPLVAVSTVVSTPTTSLCGTPVDSPIPSRSSVPAGPEVHLRRKVIPSARMEALMRHYKAAGFFTPRDRETNLQALEDARSRHVCNSVELPPSSVHVSNSGATSPRGGCSVSGLAGEVNVHVSSISPAQQSHSEAQVHTGGRSDSHSPLVAKSVVVSTPTSSLCGTPPVLSLPSRSSVPAGPEVCLGRKVVPSARMEALM